MESLNGRRIKYLKLHGGDAFIPGIGGLGNTLPSPSKSLDLNMTHSEQGVYIVINKTKAFCLIPWANVQLAEYLPG